MRVRFDVVLSEWSDGGGRMTMLKRLLLAAVMVAFMAAMLLTVPTGVSWV